MLRDLTLHAEWADATVWRSVLQDTERLYDDKVRYWLHHIHTVQHAFNRLWRGQELEFPELTAFEGPRAMARWGAEAHAAAQQFLRAASPAELAAQLEIPWAERLVERFGKEPRSVSVEQSMLQVALHSVHHRGQVASRLRELGGEPPLMDFIAWLWLDRPGAEWPDPSDR